MLRRQRYLDGLAARQMNIEIQRIGAQRGARPVDWAARAHAVEGKRAGDDLDAAAAGQIQRGDLPCGDVSVVRRPHLFGCRQVQPQLKPAQPALSLLRHLRMDDAARGGHPLHVAGPKIAAIAQMILVPHVAVQHVGDGLEATMRMRRESRQVVLRIVRIKFIEHQERIDVQAALAANAATELHARAVRSRHATG